MEEEIESRFVPSFGKWPNGKDLGVEVFTEKEENSPVIDSFVFSEGKLVSHNL